MTVLPPFEVTARFTEDAPGELGAKRTIIARLAPPARLNDAPDTIVNGDGTVALPVSVPPPVFWTVKVPSTDPPTTTLPKSTDTAGEKARDGVSLALALGHVPDRVYEELALYEPCSPNTRM